MSEKTVSYLRDLKRYAKEHIFEETLSYIKNTLGAHRASRVAEGVYENRVVKCTTLNGRTLWFYLGKKEVYLIIPMTFCSCMDFLINVVERKIVPTCYHLASQILAENYGKYRRLSNITVDEEEAILEEVEKYKYSPTLVRLLVKKEQIKNI